LTFNKKYCGKNLFVCFRTGEIWYLYPHDEVLGQLLSGGRLIGTKSWDQVGGYDFPNLNPRLKALLDPYELKPGLKLSV